MSCAEFMYQFYPPYFPHKTSSNDIGKFSTPGMFDASHSNANHSYSSTESTRGHTNKRESEVNADTDPDLEPKGSQYLNPNCVLLTYFNGDTATVVDEHFSRALSQPSSFTLEKHASQSHRRSSDTPLMCQRKLPPSFWNSSYQPPPRSSFTSGNSSDYTRDYLTSSWYTLPNNWPYHFASQSYSSAPDFARSFPYSSFDSAASKLSPSYQSLMLRSGFDSARNSKYEMSKLSDTLPSAAGSYYALQRFGADLSPNMNYDSSTASSLDYPLQSMRKELCW